MQPLRIVIVEDSPDDAELLLRELTRAGFAADWSRVETEPDFLAALESRPDLICSDYSMPRFSGLRALELLQASGRDIPFLLVSGAVGEEVAVEAMRVGATDYLLKDRLARLGSAVRRALKETQLRADRAQALEAQAQLAAIVASSDDAIVGKTLEGTITSWNAGAEQIFGYTAGEAVGRPIEMLVPPDRLEEESDILAQLAHGKSVRHFETVRVRKDGARIDVSVTVSPIVGHDGRVVGASKIARDITLQKRSEQELKASEGRYRRLFESAKDGICILDADTGRVVDVNPFLIEMLGYASEEMVGRKLWEIGSLQHIGIFRTAFHELQKGAAIQSRDVRLETADGRQLDVEFIGSVYLVDGKSVIQCSIRDLTERRKAEEALFAEKERAQVTLHSIGDAVLSTDAEGAVTYLNAAAERLAGWASTDAMGRPLLEVFNVIDATTRAAIDDPGAAAVRFGQPVALTTNRLLIRPDGSELPIEDSAAPIHDQNGRVTGAVIVFRDMSAARALSLKLAHFAQYDVLTDLPNRTLFDDRLSQAIVLARRQSTRAAVLFVDLDRFKQINDSLGHATGDALLQSVTARLLACVRRSDTVSRRGGDEFVVLLSPLHRADHAAAISEEILGAIASPHEIADQLLHVTASVGISIYPDDGDDPRALISAADEAMYNAKQSGRNSSRFFTPQMNTRRLARRSIETSLRDALERDEFELHYQPKVDLGTSRMTAVEALVRWQHPTRGFMGPGEFVPIAEESGLILPIGRWVLREACRQAREWQDAGLRPMRIAVNVSAIEFRAPTLLKFVSDVLEETALDPRYLELEVTESVLMADAESTTAALYALKDLGIQLAVDDFGTGYSSLSYLSRFPIDTLKIDRSFVQDMAEGGNDDAIINAVIGMGRSLKLCVIAEGVETAGQVASLQRLSCAEGQGFYFCRPVGAAQFATLLRQEAPLAN